MCWFICMEDLVLSSTDYRFAPLDLSETISQNRLLGLLRMLAGYRWHYIAAILAMAVAAASATGTMLIIGWFVDDLLTPPPVMFDFTAFAGLNLPRVSVLRPDLMDLLPLVAAAFLVLALVQGVFSYLSGRLAAQTAESIAWRLKNYLFDHLQRLNFSYHDRMQTGELIQRVTSDVEAIRRFYIEQGVGIGRILLTFSVNWAAVLYINVTLGLLTVIVLPFLIGISLYFFKRISDKYEEFQEQEARLSATLQEHLSGVRVVRAFARQEHERDKFEAENWQKFLRGKELLTLNAIYWPMTDNLTGVQFIFGLGVAGLMVIGGDITVGNFITYLGVIWAIMDPMRQLGRLVVQAATGLGSYARIREIIEVEREPLGEDAEPPVRELRGEIVFEEVAFQYDEHTPVLHDISFRAEPGQTVAILGATGSGKTSLLALLPRFYDYTGGQILLDGHDLKDYPRAFLRQHIGVVEQEPFLFSRSIKENITYGVSRQVTDDEVYAAARAAAVHDVIESFPEGYQTLVGERGVTLSGGQKQRVALARTLLKNPTVLILDDATSSVDTETEAVIREALNGKTTVRTTFVIAHRVTTLMHADLILVMEDGHIVQSGTHDDLVSQPGIYRETYEMQSRIENDLEEELAHVG